MRVVNDRRKLPRVAVGSGAVLYSPRGQFQCTCVDLSAGGMAVVAGTSAKVKERVRVHVQLVGFPLLTDALVVRARQVGNAYLWGLRFLRLDPTTRSNLEAFVRQQLAAAARVRQAQLYAARLQGYGPPKSAPIAGIEHGSPHKRAPPAQSYPAVPVATPPTGSAPTLGPPLGPPATNAAPVQPAPDPSAPTVRREPAAAVAPPFPSIESSDDGTSGLLEEPSVPHKEQAPQEKVWEIDEADLEFAFDEDHAAVRHQTPGYEQELSLSDISLEPADEPAREEPVAAPVEEPQERSPSLPIALEIVDFDAQPGNVPRQENSLFVGHAEPGLYDGVPDEELDPDERPTPPTGLRFGDVQANPTDLTPTDAKMKMTDEVLDAVDTGKFKRVDAAPTSPVSVWPPEHDPQDNADFAGADFGNRSTHVSVTTPEEHEPTTPGYEVLPEFDYEPEYDPTRAREEDPAVTGETVIAEYKMRPPDPSRKPAPRKKAWPAVPDLAVIPDEVDKSAVSGFTIVAPRESFGAAPKVAAVLSAAPRFQSNAEENATANYTPMPQYGQVEDVATRVQESRVTVDGLRVAMPGAAVAEQQPAPLKGLTRAPPGPSARLETTIDSVGRPAPPPAARSNGRKSPKLRGSGSVARPVRGRRPGPGSFPVIPPDLGDPNVSEGGTEIVPPNGQPRHSSPTASRGSPPQPGARPGRARTVPQSQIPTGVHDPVGPTGTIPESRVPTSPHEEVRENRRTIMRGSVPAAKPDKRQLVEDALAQLRAQTKEKRMERGEPAPAPVPWRPRRKRRGKPVETTDPRLADLFREAIKDLERAREE